MNSVCHIIITHIRNWILALFLSVSLPALSQPQIQQVLAPGNNVQQYDVAEWEISLQAAYTNPYDPDQVKLWGSFYSPDGDSARLPGFQMQPFLFPAPDQLTPQGNPVWKIRFCFDQPGKWFFRIHLQDSSGITHSNPDSITILPSSFPGFVRGTAGNYFVLDNGEVFLTLGMNLAWGIPEGSYAMYEVWMDSLAANGANFIKIMLVPWSLSLEWDDTGLGYYDARQARARHLDWILELARQRGIRIQLAFSIHDVLSSQWNNHWAQSPYNLTNGGPCSTVQDFFTLPEAKALFKRKLRYILARWSAYPEIIAWEILSEADNVEGYNQFAGAVSLWLQEMNVFVNQSDPWKRPLSAGFALTANDASYWNHPLTTFTQIHSYDDFPDFEKEMYNATRRYQTLYPKPSIVGEMGMAYNPDSIIQDDPEGIATKNALWTTLLSGALGSGMSWWWDNYIHPQSLYRHFRGPGEMLHLSSPDSSWMPVRPQIRNTPADSLEIEPAFNQLFSKAPANDFLVENGGILDPPERMLGSVLYGNGFLVNAFRNPPTFRVDFPEDGQLIIRTGNYVVSSVLQISLNGIPIFSQAVSANNEYEVFIPEGKHLILVENSSPDNAACEIREYAFFPYRSRARAFALQGQRGAMGWIQHQDFHWKEWYLQGAPAVVNGAELVFTGFPDTVHTVHWMDASTGTALSSSLVYPSLDTLFLIIPDFTTDIAFRVDKGNTAGVREQEAEEAGALSVFPNPSIGFLQFDVDLPRAGRVEILVFDSLGKEVARPFRGFLPMGRHRIPWAEAGDALRPGLYIGEIRTGNWKRSVKIIRQ